MKAFIEHQCNIERLIHQDAETSQTDTGKPFRQSVVPVVVRVFSTFRVVSGQKIVRQPGHIAAQGFVSVVIHYAASGPPFIVRRRYLFTARCMAASRSVPARWYCASISMPI